MADDNRNHEAGTDTAADGRFLSSWDKVDDGELSDAEEEDASGYLFRAKKPDEDAGPDGRYLV